MATVIRPLAPSALRPQRRPAFSALFAACRLEDGARWALLGAAVAAAALVVLLV